MSRTTKAAKPRCAWCGRRCRTTLGVVYRGKTYCSRLCGPATYGVGDPKVRGKARFRGARS